MDEDGYTASPEDASGIGARATVDERAADRYAEFGSRPDEAGARLRAAGEASATGDAARAHDQLARARAFLDSVGARALVRDAEKSASGSRGRPRLRR